MPYRGRTEFRTTGGHKVFVVVILLISTGITWMSFAYDADTWIIAACALIALAGAVAVLEQWTAFIRLGDSALHFREGFRPRTVARDTIASVSAEKGCPITLILNDGSLVRLPDLGYQGIDNSIRAWVKAR